LGVIVCLAKQVILTADDLRCPLFGVKAIRRGCLVEIGGAIAAW